jgi:hypothetical protein
MVPYWLVGTHVPWYGNTYQLVRTMVHMYHGTYVRADGRTYVHMCTGMAIQHTVVGTTGTMVLEYYRGRVRTRVRTKTTLSLHYLNNDLKYKHSCAQEHVQRGN